MSINFSIPNTPSLSKTTPDSSQTIFVPDINYLTKFSKGDLGIADNIRTNTILNTVSSSKNKEVTATYLKSAGGVINSPEKYLQNGKYNIPASAISLDSSKNQAGLKALEKSIIQSIFDSQKPYMDMFSQLSNILITAEDVIARVLSLPEKSLKPATNPRALGYNKNGKIATKDELTKLNSLNDSNADILNGNKKIINKDGSLPNNYHYEIESTVYSTGEFNPNVNYTYEYIDINNITPTVTGTNSNELNNTDSDTSLPQTIIIAIFDNLGNIITDTSSYNFSWLNNQKWFGSFDYLSDNDVDNINLFKNYYTEYTKENLPSDMSESDKQDCINQVNTLLSADNNKIIMDQISNLKSDGYFKSVKYSNSNLLTCFDNSNKPNTVSFIINKKAFAPKKLDINGKDIWIDTESNYDFKLIRCDAVDKDNDNDINTPAPLSKEVYGGDDNNVESIDIIHRNKKLDNTNDELFIDNFGRATTVATNNKTYYILEGILNTNNPQSYEKLNNSNDGFSYYNKKSFFSAPAQFIKLIIQIASKLTPSISAITKMAANPSSFVTNIMKSNLGDNNGTKDVKFLFFSTEFVNKFSSLKNSNDKSYIIKNSVLKNFVVLNKDGSYKFLLSGFGTSYLRNIKIGQSVSSDLMFATSSTMYSSLTSSPTPNNGSNNINYNKLNFTTTTTETIDYIGGYNPNVTYKYIYVNQTVLNILQDAQASEDSGDLDSALSKYGDAQKLDPDNTTISDKIAALKKLINSYGGNALFGFILNMITLPLEIVLGIIDEIVKILKKFTSPATLISAITDLVSFKIFPGGLTPIDFFTPTNVLKLAKMSFNIDLFMSWISSILVAPLDSYDLNKIIQMPFITSLPTYSLTQFKSLVFGHKQKTPNILPLKMLTGILKIFEGIINAIISFFWSLMGIGGLLKQPILKFTKDSNTDISPSDIQALLNGTYTDVIDPNSTSPNYNFIYNIQLPDGRTLRQLDSVELQKFIDDNSNFQYQYNF